MLEVNEGFMCFQLIHDVLLKHTQRFNILWFGRDVTAHSPFLLLSVPNLVKRKKILYFWFSDLSLPMNAVTFVVLFLITDHLNPNPS